MRQSFLIILSFLLLATFMGCEHESTDTAPLSQDLDDVFGDFAKRLTKYSRNNDSAVFYGNEMLRLALVANENRYLVPAYNAKASALEQLEQYDSAIYYYEQALEYFSPGVDSTHLSQTVGGLGHCYFYNEWYDLALKYYQQDIAIGLALENEDALTGAYSNAGMVLMINEIYDEAIDYFNKAITLGNQLGQNTGILPPLHNLADCHLRLENYDSAIYYAEQVKAKSEALKLDFGIGMASQVMAEAYVAKEEHTQAKKVALEGKKVFSALGAERELIGIQTQLAASEIGLNNAARALKIINAQLEKNVMPQQNRLQLLKLKSDALAQSGQYKASSNAHRDYATLQANLGKQKLEQQIAQQQRAFDSELKSQQISNLETQATLATVKLNQQRIRIYGLLGLVLILSAGGYLLFKQQKVRSKTRMMKLENQLLRTQLNPHFLFNAMGAIQQYLYSQEDPQMISDYLGKFSKLTRMILNYSRQELITLQEELQFLNHYIELQKIRFEEPFEFKLELANGLDPEDLLIPPMLTQPFIENAIEHGFLHKEEKGHINMRIEEADKHIRIVVTDDGIGRTQAAVLKKKSQYQSMATQITKDRLKLIQKRLKRKANLLVKDLIDQHQNVAGTEVQLNIPLIRN